MATLGKTLIQRIILAFSTLPQPENLVYAAVLLGILTIISLPIGLSGGFLKVGFLKASWSRIWAMIALCFFAPAIIEELFFRVLFLPHPLENASLTAKGLWGCINVFLFIIYHPINARTLYPAGIKTFVNPFFLILTAILGIVCSIVYLESGSLWSAVAIHWVVVVVWLLFLGGYAKLHSSIET